MRPSRQYPYPFPICGVALRESMQHPADKPVILPDVNRLQAVEKAPLFQQDDLTSHSRAVVIRSCASKAKLTPTALECKGEDMADGPMCPSSLSPV